MSIILHIDTSDKFLYLAVSSDENILKEICITESNNHIAQIATATDALIHSAGLKIQDITGVAVLNGPGSYTGLRVGLSYAKGLCFGLDVPLFLSNKLALMHLAQVDNNHNSICVIKAMAQEYFVAQYSYDKTLLEPQLLTLAEFNALKKAGFTLNIIDETLKNELEINDFHIIQSKELYLAFVKASYVQFINNQSFNLASAVPFYYKNTYIVPPRTQK